MKRKMRCEIFLPLCVSYSVIISRGIVRLTFKIIVKVIRKQGDKGGITLEQL